MRRVLSILLCLCLLFSAVTVLSSCKKEYTGEPDVSKKVIGVDLTDYTIVYSSAISSISQTEMRTFAEAFKPVVGKNVRANKDTGSASQKEILVGDVDRQETRDALKGIKGHGWTIRVYDNKIVIAGTTHLFTRMAMNYFVSQYLSGKSNDGKVLSVNKKVYIILNVSKQHYEKWHGQDAGKC